MGRPARIRGDKLLIKENEVVRLDRLLPLSALRSEMRPSPRTDVDRQHPLLLQVVPNLFHVLTDENSLNNFTGRLGILTRKFH